MDGSDGMNRSYWAPPLQQLPLSLQRTQARRHVEHKTEQRVLHAGAAAVAALVERRPATHHTFHRSTQELRGNSKRTIASGVTSKCQQPDAQEVCRKQGCGLTTYAPRSEDGWPEAIAAKGKLVQAEAHAGPTSPLCVMMMRERSSSGSYT